MIIYCYTLSCYNMECNTRHGIALFTCQQIACLHRSRSLTTKLNNLIIIILYNNACCFRRVNSLGNIPI